MQRLRVAIVGCGEAAQILHLPSLRYLADLFEVTVVCDASAEVARRVGDEWNVPTRVTAVAEAVDRHDVDAVLVTTPDAHHATVVLAALGAGKHVLVEKPMCMTLREADEICAAQRDAGRIVQVGYMRRYAPAFLAAKRAIAGLGAIRFARAQHVLGLNELIVRPTSRVATGDDVATEAVQEGHRLRASLLAEATDEASPLVQDAYALLLSLASHDLSAIRELLGRPERVLYASAWHDAWLLSAALDYGGYVCDFVAGFDRIPRVDSFFEAHGETRVVRLDYGTSFVRNQPLTVTLTETDGASVERRILMPEWGDPFVAEWRAFHGHVVTGTEPKSSPADFRADLELFRDLAAAMR